MPGWKNISDSAEKKRAAAFETQMLAMLAKDKSSSADKPATPVTQPPVAPTRDGIQINVTTNGQMTLYDNLEVVPAPVRQQILNEWKVETGDRSQKSEAVSARPAKQTRNFEPPVIRHEPPSPSPRPRSRRVAMTLNLFLPGAGQFYLGQPVAGSVYAFGFIACFVTSIVIFLRGYGGYIQMSTGGDIFESDNLERLTHSFHTGWLGGLQVVAIVIYIASAIHLSRSAAR